MGTTVTVRCARPGGRAWARLAGLLLLLVAPSAEATPSFDLEISTGGVTELAVGRTLALHVLEPSCRCLPPPYTGERRKPARPAAMPVSWSVTPPGFATITDEGVLTATKEGVVTVHVACRDPKAANASLSLPGSRWITLHAILPAGRLPRLDGGPEMSSFLLLWDSTPFASRHEIQVEMNGAGSSWSAGFHTDTTPDHAFPWTFDVAPDRRGFDDDEGFDAAHGEARHRANVTAARLTLNGWSDGIVSGRLRFATTRGVDFDAPFQARLDDRDGVLAKASSPPPPK
jgi:hypothetical protein